MHFLRAGFHSVTAVTLQGDCSPSQNPWNNLKCQALLPFVPFGLRARWTLKCSDRDRALSAPILLSSLAQAISVCPFTTPCCLCVQGCSQGLAVGVPCISAKLCFVFFLFGLTQELPTILLMLVMKVTLLSFKCNLLCFIPFQDGVMSLGRENAHNTASRLELWRFSHMPSPEIVISDHLSSKTQQHRWESYNHPKCQSFT